MIGEWIAKQRGVLVGSLAAMNKVGVEPSKVWQEVRLL